MNDQRNTTTVGLVLVAAGVVVAVLGYLGVSAETEVAFQLPYFASAGVGALMLLGAGAAMLLSGRLSRDTARLDELEEAVRQLCVEVGRLADDLAPPRHAVHSLDLADRPVVAARDAV
jgi:outer membrane murein-binding lipoprotein Lpp